MAFDRTLCYELNRLAGTLDGNNAPTLDEQGAANVWAGTDGLSLQGALNSMGSPGEVVGPSFLYSTSADPTDDPGEYNQTAVGLRLNAIDSNGRDFEAQFQGRTDVPMRIISDGGSSDFVCSEIDTTGDGHQRINDAGTDFIHTISGAVTISERVPVPAASGGIGVRLMCNILAGTTDLDPGPALATIP